jgi:hypothetical protein
VGLLAAANQTLNLSGGVSGSGDFIKTGLGTVKVGDSTGFTGTLSVNEGKLLVDGALSTASTTLIGNGSLLGGSGTVGTVVWNSGATFEWQLRSVTDWDVLRVAGTLDLGLLNPGDKFNLSLLSDGSLDLSSEYEWTFLQAANFAGLGSLTLGSDITNFFNITTQGMDVGTDPANVKVLVGATVNGLTNLNVWAVPEPSTGSLMMLGLSGLVVTRLLRRKVS